MLKPLIKRAIVIGKVVNKEIKTLEVHIDPFEDCDQGFNTIDGQDFRTERISDATANLAQSFPLTVKSLYDSESLFKYITIAIYFGNNKIQKLYKEYAYTNVFQSNRL